MPKSSIQKERAESLFKRRVVQQVEDAKALTDHQLKEQATRVLTAKLRAERLARERREKARNLARHGPKVEKISRETYDRVTVRTARPE